ncbi:MAG TPA: ferredoxin family protein [Spirochaetota bacterium]|nr:ferredoxin family protein [Spirochaetota bacterium]HPH01685.1 ferredoxin family protein [Spirochaetota bacterium]HPN82093.1 ferredoxin family protein [Spirochaetota bacterium]
MASYVRIEPENCKGCGLCIVVCPTKQLSFSGKFNSHSYNYIQASNDNCRGCGFCYYTCPEPGAIEVHQDTGKKEQGGAQ